MCEHFLCVRMLSGPMYSLTELFMTCATWCIFVSILGLSVFVRGLDKNSYGMDAMWMTTLSFILRHRLAHHGNEAKFLLCAGILLLYLDQG